MPRQLNLRWIEAFKAVIENGTVSRAAEILNLTQPATSKLIAHLEAHAGVILFDRLKGRLAPTEHAMRLYEEVERIFSGVRQVENALDAIRREEQGRLAVGVMAGSGGAYIQRATTAFQRKFPNVFCSVRTLHSQWIVDWLVTRKLDVGLVSARVDNPYLSFEPAMSLPLICILPPDHELAGKSHIEPQDLHEVAFVGFPTDTYIGRMVDLIFEKYEVRPQIKVVANVAPTVSEFVAAGAGVSLVHPLWVNRMEDELVLKRFEPETLYHFQLCRSQENRNAKIIDAFMQELHSTANELSKVVQNRIAAD